MYYGLPTAIELPEFYIAKAKADRFAQLEADSKASRPETPAAKTAAEKDAEAQADVLTSLGPWPSWLMYR